MTDNAEPDVPCHALGREGSGFRVVQERLVAEVLRKLSLAEDADRKEDRDIICSEVFADITGDINSAAQGRTGTLYHRWYEVLAPYFCADVAAGEQLLRVFRQLWGQPFTTPTYALLLHQWLLVHPEAGGPDQRLKYINVLVSGARQLFVGDADTGIAAFAPMYHFFAEQVVLAPDGGARLRSLPETGREAVMGLVAAFAPYYLSGPEFVAALESFPSPSAVSGAGRGRPRPGTQSPGAPPLPGERREGTDFALSRVAAALAREVTAEPGLLTYLGALAALGPTAVLSTVRARTRVRLQAEIYTLTQSGGPRYASRRVNREAFRALDALFPRGRHVRRVVNAAFRMLHPGDWPWLWWDALTDAVWAVRLWLLALWGLLCALWSRLLVVLPTRRRRHAD